MNNFQIIILIFIFTFVIYTLITFDFNSDRGVYIK